jgi:type IV secretion system protein VirB10
MPVKEIGDPRLQALFGASDPRDGGGVRPTVRLPSKGLPPLAFAAVALVLALFLFLALNARRTRQAEPATHEMPSENGGSAWSSPPPLYIPPIQQPAYGPAPIEQEKPAPLPAPAAAPAIRAAPAPAAIPVQVVQPLPSPPPPAPERTSSGAPLVIDTGGSSAASSPSGSVAASQGGSPTGAATTQPIVRMRASSFANRSMTVPQGYLIPAVLETGFDSTKPGFARAIVSRDVRGFDGRQVLIPRGSRLIGEYQSAIGQSQNRAVITWTRLMRPDGMTIEMQSPAVDTVGRGGVPASVNSHFFARLGNALLQSTFQIGQLLAGRSAVTGPVVVVSGNAASAATQVAAPVANYVPTLKVPPGKSINIFVAQDLDFTAAGVPK